VTVAVVQPTVRSSEFDEKDVELEWFSGTGKGGQHRNKHQNSCKLLHKPSGIMAKAECRSRDTSKNQAMLELRKRVDGFHNLSYKSAEDSDRKQQVGCGARGDKIRTYRLQDDVVIDHRNELKTSWRDFEKGRW
jgi:peptide chain release factor 1